MDLARNRVLASDQLKAIVERIERMHVEKKAIEEDIREIYVEAKANGFDTKALRHVVKLRGQDSAERQEFEAIVEIYMQALGMLPDAASRATREEPPSDGAVKSVRHRRNPELARGAEEPPATHPVANPEEAGDATAGAPANDAGSRPSRGHGTPATVSASPIRDDLEIPTFLVRSAGRA